MDTHELAKTGFTTIRNLLQGRVEGGDKAALALAEALHNLPDPGNTFQEKITQEKIRKFIESYPHLAPPFNNCIADWRGRSECF